MGEINELAGGVSSYSLSETSFELESFKDGRVVKVVTAEDSLGVKIPSYEECKVGLAGSIIRAKKGKLSSLPSCCLKKADVINGQPSVSLIETNQTKRTSTDGITLLSLKENSWDQIWSKLLDQHQIKTYAYIIFALVEEGIAKELEFQVDQKQVIVSCKSIIESQDQTKTYLFEVAIDRVLKEFSVTWPKEPEKFLKDLQMIGLPQLPICLVQ